jgi:hypothetical protein
MSFSPLALESITPFIAFELVVEGEGLRREARFLVKAELVGAPSDRHDRLLASLLRDRADVLRYLLLLLMDGGTDPAGTPAGLSLVLGLGVGGSSAPPTDVPVLEAMAQALSRDPVRLDHVAALVRSLQSSTDGADKLPPGFLEIWEPIQRARRALAS